MSQTPNPITSADGGWRVLSAFVAQCPAAAEFLRWHAMRTSFTPIWFTLLISFAAGCSRVQGLVGSWQTETVRAALPGHVAESYQTWEFLKDGSFKMISTITTDGKKQTIVVFTGTYALVDTNHVRLEVAPNQAQPSDKTPLTVTFSIIGDELEMSKLTSSVVPETQKYRRVK